MEFKKPKLDQKVYVLYTCSITQTKVEYLGKDKFLVEDYASKIDEAQAYEYKNYNFTWFTSLKKAKEQLLLDHPDSKIKKIDEDYWEAQYD